MGVVKLAVVAVVGHLTSGTSLAAGRVYGAGRRPVAMISPSASSPDLSGLSPWIFRVCPTDLSHGAQLARYARETLRARRVGLIYLDDDYGRGLRLSFGAEFRRLGGVVVEEDPHLAATVSLEPYLSRMRQAGGVDVLMLATERGGAELALRDPVIARLAELTGPIKLRARNADGPFGALARARINVVAIAQGSSELNISVVVEARQAAEAQRRIHDAFQLSRIALDGDVVACWAVDLDGEGGVPACLCGCFPGQVS